MIVGAGPAGLSAGYDLAAHYNVNILEQDPKYVGGISRTVEYHGYRFDIGGHRFFSKNAEVANFWDHILGEDLLVRRRLSRIYYESKFYDYPLKPANTFRNLGLLNTTLCIADYLKAQALPKRQVTTFEDWVINHFGERLYQMFFKAYTEKVWGVSCDEISADWAAQRINGLNLWTAIKNAFRAQGNSGKNTVIKTLVDEFRYPKLGPGMLWEAVVKDLTAMGGKVWMGHKVVRLQHEHGRVTVVESLNLQKKFSTFASDYVISSMSLRSLVRGLRPRLPDAVIAAAEALQYRDFLTVALIVDHPDLFPDNWIYVHDPRVKVGRIQNFKNWSPYMVPNPETTCLGLEYFCFEGDSLWNASDADLIQLATREISQTGLLKSARVIDGKVVRVPKAYPVYDDQYKKHVAIVVEELRHVAANVQIVGRNGMHRYNNQDHAMMTGFLAARNILGDHYNLWAVNGDAEYLEEVAENGSIPVNVRAVKLS